MINKGLFWAGSFTLSLALLVGNAEAGAWTLEAGKRKVISSVIIDRANSQFGPALDTDVNPNFSKVETISYVEQGFLPNVTIIGQAAFQRVSFDNGSEQVSFNGLGNVSLGVRYGIYKSDKQVVSAEVHGIINGGGEDIPDGDLGRGGTSAELRALYGRNIKFGEKNGFLDAQFAIRPRFNNDPLEWRASLSSGVELGEKLLLIGQGFYTNNSGTTRNPLDPVLRTQSVKAQASFVYWIKPKYGLQFGVFKTIWGENIVDEEALVFGVWQRF